MAAKITDEENQQLQRTVEMFEAIAEHQPDDYQSLEILKEAYAKLGQQDKSLKTSKRLAKAYVTAGQVSQAILEFEGIIKEFPNDPDAKAALAELEAKTATPATDSNTSASPLTEHSKPTAAVVRSAGARPVSDVRARPEDGDMALANALIGEKLVTPQAVEPLLAKLHQLRTKATDTTVPLSLVPLLVSEQLLKHDDLLLALIEKSRLPYMPLSTYDVDRDVACLLPQDICFQHCLVPFDLISRSVMITTANPFDQNARKQVEAMLDYHVFWFISPPSDIVTALRHAHGLDAPRKPSQAAKT